MDPLSRSAAMPADLAALQERVAQHSTFVEQVTDQVARVVVGQEQMVDALLIGMLTNGHVLLEGVPGLAKTLAVNTLASCLNGTFKRIQFSPDLLPADLVGTLVFDPSKGQFSPRRGPVFANLVLADEVNRAPAKVQSALLECMQERQVTIGDTTYPLDDPFLVLATMNPIEQEGTYALPEAQVDRFMLKVRVGYPSREEERLILDRMTGEETPVAHQVATLADVIAARSVVTSLYVNDRVKDYIVSLVLATRDPKAFGLDLTGLVRWGASPRATLALLKAARAHAFLRRRAYITPEDVKAVAGDVLRHRVVLTYEAEAEDLTTDDIVRRVLDAVEVP